MKVLKHSAGFRWWERSGRFWVVLRVQSPSFEA